MKFDFLKKLFDGKKRVPKTDITKRFELLGRVGQGSMSRVWRARDTSTGKVIALKVVDKEKSKRFEARFAPELNKPSEGEVAVTLKHRHIVDTSEWGMTSEGEQFLVMEFVDGLGLSYLVDVQNDVMKKRRLSFMIQLGEAIRYFHEEKWIHRDICPRNIMVSDGDWQVKLIDFGLVVPNTAPFQAPGNRTGTANYMAPELIKRQRTDQRIDIFSFAVTCFEMFTRRYPWEAAASLEAVLQHINNPPVDIRVAVPGIDEQVAAAIMKGLQINPKDRWQTMDPMLYQFREAQQRLSPTRSEKSKKSAKAATQAEAKPKTKTPAKTPNPGITLAEEGITLAEDEPQPEPNVSRKSAIPTPGITIAEEGITLAEDQPDGAAVPPIMAKAANPGITLAEEGITLAEDQPESQDASPAKAKELEPGITFADAGITVADDEPPAEEKSRPQRETADEGPASGGDKS